MTETSTTTRTKARRCIVRQPLSVAQVPDSLLHLTTAASISGLSQATLRRKAASDPTFPKLIKIGQRCTRIRAGDLTQWLAAQAGA